MKKKMELKISLTFVIIFLIGSIISGLYCVIAIDSSFLSYGTISNGLFYALAFLYVVWNVKARHPILRIVGIIGGLLYSYLVIMELTSLNIGNGIELGLEWSWSRLILTLLLELPIILLIVRQGEVQGQELLQEEEEEIRRKFNNSMSEEREEPIVQTISNDGRKQTREITDK